MNAITLFTARTLKGEWDEIAKDLDGISFAQTLGIYDLKVLLLVQNGLALDLGSYDAWSDIPLEVAQFIVEAIIDKAKRIQVK